MISETDFFEDKEIEVDGYIYRFDGRVDYKYVHSCGHRELVECDNVEITGIDAEAEIAKEIKEK